MTWNYHSGITHDTGAERCYYNAELKIFKHIKTRYSDTSGWGKGKVWFENEGSSKKFTSIESAIEEQSK